MININIWDDFYDDGYIPEGKKQETFIYVEEEDLPDEKQKQCLDILFEYITKTLNIDGIKMWIEYYDSKNKYPHLNEKDNPLFMKENPDFHFSRWEIRIEDLTHERLDEWMNHFGEITLFFNAHPFDIYSSS